MLWAFGCPEVLNADGYTRGKGRAASSRGAGLCFYERRRFWGFFSSFWGCILTPRTTRPALLQGTLDVHEIEPRGTALQSIAQRGSVRGWSWVSVSSGDCGTFRAFSLAKGSPPRTWGLVCVEGRCTDRGFSG